MVKRLNYIETPVPALALEQFISIITCSVSSLVNQVLLHLLCRIAVRTLEIRCKVSIMVLHPVDKRRSSISYFSPALHTIDGALAASVPMQITVWLTDR